MSANTRNFNKAANAMFKPGMKVMVFRPDCYIKYLASPGTIDKVLDRPINQRDSPLTEAGEKPAVRIHIEQGTTRTEDYPADCVLLLDGITKESQLTIETLAKDARNTVLSFRVNEISRAMIRDTSAALGPINTEIIPRITEGVNLSSLTDKTFQIVRTEIWRINTETMERRNRPAPQDTSNPATGSATGPSNRYVQVPTKAYNKILGSIQWHMEQVTKCENFPDPLFIPDRFKRENIPKGYREILKFEANGRPVKPTPTPDNPLPSPEDDIIPNAPANVEIEMLGPPSEISMNAISDILPVLGFGQMITPAMNKDVRTLILTCAIYLLSLVATDVCENARTSTDNEMCRVKKDKIGIFEDVVESVLPMLSKLEGKKKTPKTAEPVNALSTTLSTILSGLSGALNNPSFSDRFGDKKASVVTSLTSRTFVTPFQEEVTSIIRGHNLHRNHKKELTVTENFARWMPTLTNLVSHPILEIVPVSTGIRKKAPPSGIVPTAKEMPKVPKKTKSPSTKQTPKPMIPILPAPKLPIATLKPVADPVQDPKKPTSRMQQDDLDDDDDAHDTVLSEDEKALFVPPSSLIEDFGPPGFAPVSAYMYHRGLKVNYDDALTWSKSVGRNKCTKTYITELLKPRPGVDMFKELFLIPISNGDVWTHPIAAQIYKNRSKVQFYQMARAAFYNRLWAKVQKVGIAAALPEFIEPDIPIEITTTDPELTSPAKRKASVESQTRIQDPMEKPHHPITTPVDNEEGSGLTDNSAATVFLNKLLDRASKEIDDAGKAPGNDGDAEKSDDIESEKVAEEGSKVEDNANMMEDDGTEEDDKKLPAKEFPEPATKDPEDNTALSPKSTYNRFFPEKQSGEQEEDTSTTTEESADKTKTQVSGTKRTSDAAAPGPEAKKPKH
jgi:hypothetical protein